MLDRLFASREKKLGEAIAKEDLSRMAQYLELGVRKVDYLRTMPADFDNGKTQIPVGKYSDPVKLAQDIGLNDQGMRLLQQYGLGDGPAPRSPSYSR
jgi:hypothetical protein